MSTWFFYHVFPQQLLPLYFVVVFVLYELYNYLINIFSDCVYICETVLCQWMSLKAVKNLHFNIPLKLFLFPCLLLLLRLALMIEVVISLEIVLTKNVFVYWLY